MMKESSITAATFSTEYLYMQVHVLTDAWTVKGSRNKGMVLNEWLVATVLYAMLSCLTI